MSKLPDTPEENESTVRRAHIPDNLSYETMSDLGRDLFDLSREYEASGEPLLSEQEIEIEITRRRGGFTQEDVS